MSQLPRVFKNRILASLPREEITRLAPHLTPVPLAQHQTLIDGAADYAYFVETGVVSVVATSENGATVEVGVIGFEGFVGIPIVLDTGSGGPGRTFVQIAGSGYRIGAQSLRDEFARSPELRRFILRYIQGFMVQTAQTAACNRLHNIEERLARWLLTCHDRIGSDQLHLTHEFLGQMLGSPRTTVTLAAGLLHRAGMIDYSRGLVTVKNRVDLENSACECYRLVQGEFRRLGLL